MNNLLQKLRRQPFITCFVQQFISKLRIFHFFATHPIRMNQQQKCFPQHNFFLSLNYFSSVMKKSLNSFNIQAKEIDFFFETSVVFKGKNEKKNWTRNQTYAGEDAFFISENKKTIGIADGVGGWASSGIDSSNFSWQLMENSKLFADSTPNLTSNLVLTKAYNLIHEKDQVEAGSSTACIVNLKDNKLEYSNLGDSGFLLYRPMKGVIYRTIEQQHFFNAPFQLMYVTPSLRRKFQVGGNLNDLPSHADQNEFKVEKNDILVLGTDGLFDNLFDEEIVEIIEKCKSNIDQISKELLNNTLKRSHSKIVATPFAINAMNSGVYFTGGKIDDITIIIGKVKNKE